MWKGVLVFLALFGLGLTQTISSINNAGNGNFVLNLEATTFTGAGNVGFELASGFTGTHTIQGSVDENGDPATIIDCESNSRFVWARNGNGHYAFRNVIIQNCIATTGNGGAIDILDWADEFEFDNVIFQDNSAPYGNGGGISFVQSSEFATSAAYPTITNCQFESNIAGNWDSTFEDCGPRPFYQAPCGQLPPEADPTACTVNQTFDCEHSKGGGVFIYTFTPVFDEMVIRDTIFTHNRAFYEGAGLWLRFTLGNEFVHIRNLEFYHNNASAASNAMYDHPAGGGGLYMRALTPPVNNPLNPLQTEENIHYAPVLSYFTFKFNHANPAGGNLLIEGNCPHIEHTILEGAWAHGGSGGYIACRKEWQFTSNVRLTNITVFNNTAASYGVVPDFLVPFRSFQLDDDPYYGPEFIAVPMMPRIVNGIPYMIYFGIGAGIHVNQSGDEFFLDGCDFVDNWGWIGTGLNVMVDAGGEFAGASDWVSNVPTAPAGHWCRCSNATFVGNVGWLAGGGIFHDFGCRNGEMTNIFMADCTAAWFGGGFCYEMEVIMEITNMSIYNCSNDVAGGGLWAGGAASGRLTETHFKDCSSGSGAANFMFLTPALQTIVEDSSFINCSSADVGGGLYVRTVLNSANVEGRRDTATLSHVIIRNTTFFNNSLVKEGEPLFGAGLYARDVTLEMYDSWFEGNYLNGSGSLKGGAAFIQFVPNATMNNITFIGNGIYGGRAFPAFGGAIFAEDSDIYLSDSVVRDNFVTYREISDRADLFGGGIFLQGGPESSSQLPALLDLSGHVEVSGNTIGREDLVSENVVHGAGIMLQEIAFLRASGDVEFSNNIAIGSVQSKGGAVGMQLDGNASFDGTLFRDNYCSGEGGAVGIVGGFANFTDCTFNGNKAYTGGALYGQFNTFFRAYTSDFTDNNATLSGGVAYLADDVEAPSFLHVADSSFTGNRGFYRGLFHNKTSAVTEEGTIIKTNNFPEYYDVTNASQTDITSELSDQPGDYQNLLIVARDSRGVAKRVGGDTFTVVFEYVDDLDVDTNDIDNTRRHATKPVKFHAAGGKITKETRQIIQGADFEFEFRDNEEGTYTMLYKPTLAGILQVSVFLWQEDIDAGVTTETELGPSPIRQLINPSDPVSGTTFVVNEQAFDDCKMCGECSIIIQLVDEYGNPWTESTGRLSLEAEVTGVANGILSVDDIGEGLMGITWSQSAGGFHSMSITILDPDRERRDIQGSPFEYSPKYRTSHLCTSSTEVAMLVLCALSGGLMVVFLIFVLINQTTWVVKASTPLFLILSLTGSIIAILGTSFLLHYPEKSFCSAHLWLFGTGFILMIAPICAKNYRVMKIFGNRSLKVRVIPFRILFGFVAFFLLIEWVFLAIWTGVDTPDLENFSCGNFELCEIRCGYSDVAIGLWYGYHLAIALSQVYLAFATRKVSTEFNEMKSLGFSAYNITLTLSFILGVLFTLQEDTSTYISLIILGQLVCVVFTMIALVTPKMYLIMRGKGNEEFFSTAGGASHGGGSTNVE